SPLRDIFGDNKNEQLKQSGQKQPVARARFPHAQCFLLQSSKGTSTSYITSTRNYAKNVIVA
ncbi:hypothetical protein KEM56_003200, partial [Ascosphaera pollenicola]